MSNTSDENAGCASPSGSEVELINSSSNARESSDFKTDSPTTGVVKDTGSDVGTALSEDDLLVIDMGYKPTLHRGLNSFMNFAYGFTEVSVLCSIAITYSLGLSNGGNVVILWAFVVQFFCVMFIAHSMAEICSAFPSAGSVYHWSAQLASKEHGPLWSYITGWWNFIGKYKK